MLKLSFIAVCVLLMTDLSSTARGQQLKTTVKDQPVPAEDIFIHTDRDEYIAGENFWYAAYLFDRKNNNKPGLSETGYIELLNSNNNPVIQRRFRLKDGNGNGNFQLPDTLSSGTYILRSYTNLIRNMPPENCFMKVIRIYNSFSSKGFRKILYAGAVSQQKQANTPGISVKSPGLSPRREKITLEIEIDKLFSVSPENTILSISVKSASGNDFSDSIDDYLHLDSRQAVPDDIRFKPEVLRHFLYGRLIPQKAGAIISNQIVLLSVPGKEAVFQYSITDREGNFRFVIRNDDAPAEIIVQQKSNENDNLIRIVSPFMDNYPEYKITLDTIVSDIPDHIAEWSMNHQVSKIYGLRSAGESVAADTSEKVKARFYGIPDMELKMADYILLPAMQEVFFELIPGVAMRTGRGRYNITVANPYYNRTYEADATLMVDGVIIGDPAVIAEMNPELVERIDILRKEYVVGGYHFYGIVNVITKSGNYGSLPLPGNAVRFPYRIFDPEVPFVSPDYSETDRKKSRVPDFRNTLYWNPGVSPGADGKVTLEFWASDYISDYEIDIQGITSDGIPLSFKKSIRIE